ncbi:MAG TPA: threonylcarbamoyl-AMP synthase [Phycisphaerae bacterium]|nr:threonylcarbamoyl-AMP synthase [Phycisphaerae bacterium]
MSIARLIMKLVPQIMNTRVITVRSSRGNSVAAAAKQGAEALKAGQLVAFATETVYGLAALATDRRSVDRLRKLKSRPRGPFSVHVSAPDEVRRYVENIPPRAEWLMGKTWPGPVTLLLDTGGKFPDKKLQRVRGLYEELTSHDVIGLRCPDDPVARRILEQVPGAVIAPSANRRGSRSPRSGEDVLATLEGKIDLLIDSGPARYGKDSSIVRIEGNNWKLLRKGVYDERVLGRYMRRKIAFVCTGNTCRSPMAAGLAKKHLSEWLRCRVGQLRSNGMEVLSAGLFVSNSSRPTPEAVQAARQRDADIARHRSRKITYDLIKSCDTVFCMTALHVEGVKRLAGEAAGVVFLLDEKRDIPDPIGGDQKTYEHTAEHIERALLGRIADGTL